MHDETNLPAPPGADEAEHLVLLLLTDDAKQSIWSRREIGDALGNPRYGADAVAGLHAAGLVHVFQDFVFPTQPALRLRELQEPR